VALLGRRSLVDLAVLGLLGAGAGLAPYVLVRTLRQPGIGFEDIGRVLPLLAAALAFWALASLWVVLRRPPVAATMVVVLAVAFVARLVLAVDAPLLSDDVYRYIWDGRVQAEGINPYRHAPSDPALAHLRDAAIYENVNRRDVPTIYPPVAQVFFRVVYLVVPDSLLWTKLALVLVDLAAIAVLAALLVRVGVGAERSIIYAWHPLAILEVGDGAHVDVLGVLLVLLGLHALASKRAVLAGALLGGATLVKLYALALAPALLRRGGWCAARTLSALAAAVLLAYLPFLAVGSDVLGYLPGYLGEQGLESGQGIYLLFQWQSLDLGLPWPLDPVRSYQVAAAAALGALALWAWLAPRASSRDAATRGLLLLALFLLLASPVQPWYKLLALALLPLAQGLALLPGHYLVATALLAYFKTNSPEHPYWPRHVIYGGLALALALAGIWALVLKAREERKGERLASVFATARWRRAAS